MTYKTYKTYFSSAKAGYEKLLVYWLAVDIFDLTVIFCERYIRKNSRTFDQMIQAARSGKQNITEGSLSRSVESNLKLISVARSSYGELLEDFRDFLRQKNLKIWDKNDPRILSMRQLGPSYKTYKTYETYKSYLSHPETFANLMLTLCFKQGYLLDKLLQALKEKFIREGGFRENLFKERINFRNKKKK
jgi:four helix bundle suffix protein